MTISELNVILDFFVSVNLLKPQEREKIIEKHKDLFFNNDYLNLLIKIVEEVKEINKEKIKKYKLKKKEKEQIKNLEKAMKKQNEYQQLKQGKQ